MCNFSATAILSFFSRVLIPCVPNNKKVVLGYGLAHAVFNETSSGFPQMYTESEFLFLLIAKYI
jgi:hypothetical protein